MFVGNGKRSSSQERPLESLDGQGVGEMPGMTQSDDQYPDSALLSNEDPLNLDSSLMIARMAEWMQNRRLAETRVRHYYSPLLSKFCLTDSGIDPRKTEGPQNPHLGQQLKSVLITCVIY